MKNTLTCLFIFAAGSFMAQTGLTALYSDFLKNCEALEIPGTEMSYKANFQKIQTNERLQQQENYFISFRKKLGAVEQAGLAFNDKIRLGQLTYETAMNLQRIALEKTWNNEGRKVPEGGLHALSNYKAWYSYYIKNFTSVTISPEDVFAMGEAEVKKIQKEIKNLRQQLGYANDADFYAALSADSFYLNDKEKIRAAYLEIDKTVRKNLSKLFLDHAIDSVEVMEWPNAGPATPPGMYLSKTDNAYGKNVLQYNFYSGRHNKRCMNWLYMHEAIPGHHLQSAVRRSKPPQDLEGQFFYYGNTEGWACYVEDHGKELGLYADPYSYLGKWEWDLVRSARLVMEVGIHYYGWSFEKAKQYWKENIKGQDDIADREINRITNWAGQALCYKVGALTIKKIVELQLKKENDIKKAHDLFLNYSDVPLQVLYEMSIQL